MLFAIFEKKRKEKTKTANLEPKVVLGGCDDVWDRFGGEVTTPNDLEEGRLERVLRASSVVLEHEVSVGKRRAARKRKEKTK